jgi:hypothetical protein
VRQSIVDVFHRVSMAVASLFDEKGVAYQEVRAHEEGGRVSNNSASFYDSKSFLPPPMRNSFDEGGFVHVDCADV